MLGFSPLASGPLGDDGAVVGPVSLTATGITTAAPSVGSSALTLNFSLTATGITTAASSVADVDLTQEYDLTATGITTAATTVGDSSLTQVQVLGASELVTVAPDLETSDITQVHDIAVTGITTAAPQVDDGDLSCAQSLSALNIACAPPTVGDTTVFIGSHSLTPAGITTAAPDLADEKIVYSAAKSSIFNSPSNYTKTIEDTQIKYAERPWQAVKSGTISVGNTSTTFRSYGSWVQSGYNYYTEYEITLNYSGSGTISTIQNYSGSIPGFQQNISDVEAAIAAAGKAKFDWFSDGDALLTYTTGTSNNDQWQFKNLAGTTTYATYNIPNFPNNNSGFRFTYKSRIDKWLLGHYSQYDNSSASDVSKSFITGLNGSDPYLTSDVSLSEYTLLTPVANTTGTPTVGDSLLTQEHGLDAPELVTLAPSISTAGITQEHSFTTPELVTLAPSVSTAALTQAQDLTPTTFASGAPDLPQVTLTQVHSLTTAELATGAPDVDDTPITLAGQLGADSIVTGAPSVGTAGLTQAQDLSATGITTAAPDLDTIDLTQDHALGATSISTGAPTVGDTSTAENKEFSAPELVTGTPSLDNTTLTENYLLETSELVTASAEVSLTALSQVHDIAVIGITTAAPVISDTDITEGMRPLDITTGLPTVPDIGNEFFPSIATGAPTVGDAQLNQAHDFVIPELVCQDYDGATTRFVFKGRRGEFTSVTVNLSQNSVVVPLTANSVE